MEGLVDVAEEVSEEHDGLSALGAGEGGVCGAGGVVGDGAGDAVVVLTVAGHDEGAGLVRSVDEMERGRP